LNSYVETLMEQRLIYAGQSVPGRVRGHNEDALLCCPQLSLWAIADGMGGHQCGEVASALALDTLQAGCADGLELADAVHAANREVLAVARTEEHQGMGTTLVAVRFNGAAYNIAWVGDSRAYRVSAGHIERVTHDHSWVQAMIDAGQMSPETARSHPQRNVILQCLGRDDQPLQVGLHHGVLGEHELLLLCSDGLTGELEDAQIQQLCSSAQTLDELVNQLLARANDMGGKDNISCIVLGRDAAAPSVARKPRGLLSRLFTSR